MWPRWLALLLWHTRPNARTEAARARAHTDCRDVAYERVMRRIREVEQQLRKSESRHE